MANKVMTVAIAYIFPGDSAMVTILTTISEKTDHKTTVGRIDGSKLRL